MMMVCTPFCSPNGELRDTFQLQSRLRRRVQIAQTFDGDEADLSQKKPYWLTGYQTSG
jgi:hypothetical protein